MLVRTIILTLSLTFLHSVSAFNQGGTDRRYINGALYAETFPGTEGHPFFQSELWYLCQFSMDGRLYEDITLRYDIYRDQVLYNHIHSTGSYIVVLNRELIENFVIDGHRFRKLPDQGFYEVMAEGKASFYVKWQKHLSDPGPDSRGEFSQITDWYIRSHGEFKKVSGKSGLVKALGDHKKEIKDFISKNHIVVKPGAESEVKRIIDYYNHLEP